MTGPLRVALVTLASLGTSALLPGPTPAQTAPAACKPLIDAEKKEIVTPHHVYQTETGSLAGKQAQAAEAITVDGATYVTVRGKWRKSPMGPKETLEQMDENLKTATVYTCQHVGTELVGGTPADVYTAHTGNEGVVADTRTWVAKTNGMPVKQEEDLNDGTDKRHFAIRWEYGNVHAPAEGSAAP